jgi:hypothetical protein
MIIFMHILGMAMGIGGAWRLVCSKKEKYNSRLKNN